MWAGGKVTGMVKNLQNLVTTISTSRCIPTSFFSSLLSGNEYVCSQCRHARQPRFLLPVTTRLGRPCLGTKTQSISVQLRPGMCDWLRLKQQWLGAIKYQSLPTPALRVCWENKTETSVLWNSLNCSSPGTHTWTRLVFNLERKLFMKLQRVNVVKIERWKKRTGSESNSSPCQWVQECSWNWWRSPCRTPWRTPRPET